MEVLCASGWLTAPSTRSLGVITRVAKGANMPTSESSVFLKPLVGVLTLLF